MRSRSSRQAGASRPSWSDGSDRSVGAGRPICAVDSDGSDIQIFHELLYGGDHRATYDAEALLRAFKHAGFAQGRRVTFRESASAVMRRETIDLYPELSLFAEASP